MPSDTVASCGEEDPLRFGTAPLARYARLDPSILRPIAQRTVAQQEALTVIRARALLVRLRTAAVNDGYSLVKTVVQVLNDGHKGFADLGQKLRRPDAREFFVSESATRAKFATELEAELALAKGDTKDIGGTAAGALHRGWGDLKASLGGGDHACGPVSFRV